MRISEKQWNWYISRLRKVNERAADSVSRFILGFGHMPETREEINSVIDYCYGISRKYGEAAAELAAQMYDYIAAASGVKVPSAVPAETADMAEVAKTVVGTLKTGNSEIVSNAIGRLVKKTGVNTTIKNAVRDGASYAWVPHGDTCAFCIMLASNGWMSGGAGLKNGQAAHIHANCDCTYAVSFNGKTRVAGYDPEYYKELYYFEHDENGNVKMENGEPVERGGNWESKLNGMRRDFYAQNKANGFRQDFRRTCFRGWVYSPTLQIYQ